MNNEPLGHGSAERSCNSTGILLTNNLFADDYGYINNCCDSTENYRSGSALLKIYCEGNATAPYFWTTRPYRFICVNGSPLNVQLPPDQSGCWSATIFAGGVNNNIFHSNWTRCKDPLPYICQEEISLPNTTPRTVNVPLISTSKIESNTTISAISFAAKTQLESQHLSFSTIQQSKDIIFTTDYTG